MLSVITKHFDGPDRRPFVPGEVVDTSDWRHEVKLEAHRYIRKASPDDEAAYRKIAAKKTSSNAVGRMAGKLKTTTRPTAHAAG